MPRKSPSDLEKLEALLLDQPGDAMLASQLDGYLAGLLVCPELIMPAEWLPPIWAPYDEVPPDLDLDGDDAPMKLIELVVAHYNRLAMSLQRGRGAYQASYEIDPANDESVWQIWIEGFARAMELRPLSWAAITPADADAWKALDGLTSLIAIADNASELHEALVDELTALAADLIPGWIEDLHEWRVRQELSKK